MSWNKLAGGIAHLAVAAALVAPAYAQVTSSGLRGTVTDAAGNPVANANVTITFLPTGQVSTTATGPTGGFFRSGLPVGGEYQVVITAPGFESATLNDLSLRLGQTESVAAILRRSQDELRAEEIVVYGTAAQSVISVNNGVGSVFDTEFIGDFPSPGRDLTNVFLADPFVSTTVVNSGRDTGRVSFAGTDPRLNGFVVDGLAQQNDFGLDAGLFPTLRQPISIDALKAISVTTSEYSVLATGFQGGLVNTVTKSGTNEFKGGLYYYTADEGLRGDTAFGNTTVVNRAFEETEYGAFIGGPILRDRLFFFANYEKFQNSNPLNFDFGATSPQMFNIIRDITRATYNYDPGDKGSTTVEEEAERILAKLDWQVNDNHRLSASYQATEDNILTNTGTFNFPTQYYNLSSDQKVYRLEAFSDWSPTFSTVFRIARKDYIRGQDSIGENSATGVNFGDFRITVSPTDPYFAANNLNGQQLLGTANREFRLGPDEFRHGNAFEDERTQYYGEGTLDLDAHTIVFGAMLEDYKLANLFNPASRGVYSFNSLGNLAGRVASVRYSNAPSNNVLDGTTAWGYNKISLFAQDTWQATDKLELTLGARVEYYDQDDRPDARPAIPVSGVPLSFEQLYGFSPGESLDGKSTIQPRVGFNYDVNDRVQVSGGFGLFAGSDPQVWISNNFQKTFVSTTSNQTGFNGRDVPQALRTVVAAGPSATAVVNLAVLDPDYEIPSVWRTSLRGDFNFDLSQYGAFLGDDWRVSLSALYGRVNKSNLWTNETYTRSDLQRFVGVAPDGRPIYPQLSRVLDGVGTQPDVIMLTNGSEGENLSLALQLSKAWDHFGFDFAYTNTKAEDQVGYGSSTAISSFRGITDFDRLNPELRPSDNEIEHKFSLNFNAKAKFIADLESRIDVFAIVQSGAPYSIGFGTGSTDSFGRANGGAGFGGADVLYVPRLNSTGTGFADSRVTFASAAVETQLLNFLRNNDLLGYQGTYIPRNDLNAPWTRRWDLRVQQELPGGFGAFGGNNRIKLVADVENFLNLINDEWGARRIGPANGEFGAVNTDIVLAGTTTPITRTGANPCVTAAACQYRYTQVASGSPLRDDLTNSVWRARIGIRYEF
jgi:outer membrane receptor for ferrienterochelin and colicin